MKVNPVPVCFISLGSYPLFNIHCNRTFGGAEVQMYLLAKELSKDQRFTVSFIVGDFGQKPVEYYDNIKVIRGNPIEKGRPTKSVKLFRAIRKADARIYIQRTASAGTGFIRLVTFFLRRKFIYMTAHQIDCDGGYERMRNFISGFLFKFGVEKADLVITQNRDHQRLLMNYHKRSSIVMRSGYEIPKNTEVGREGVLWVGRCEDWKNPQLFLNLAKRFSSHRFTMIAPRANQSDYFDEIVTKASEIKNLDYLEFVPFHKIDKYFKTAKVFVNTSIYEGFPNTFVQATKNGTPIISFKVNPDNFINRYKCGYYTGGDEEKMYHYLESVLNNKEIWEMFSNNAQIYAQKNHDITKVIKKLKRTLISLVFN